MTTAYAGRVVISLNSSPLDEGVVVADGGRIVQVGREAPTGAELIDLNAMNRHSAGGVVVVPGLVNAHTHLEFSDLASPLGMPGMRFPDWIREVIRLRLSKSDVDGLQSAPPPIYRGLRECVRTGATAIGEITKGDAAWEFPASDSDENLGADASVTAFVELLGLGDERYLWASAELDAARDRLRRDHRDWRLGVSPHAPYSTHWKLVEAMCRNSREHAAPLAMHLAESPEELELLASHCGAFRELLEDIGVWNASAVPLGGRPIDYLQLLATAHRSLVIHGNYLNEQEIEFIGERSAQMSVVYCPRTHAYFEHDAYPLQAMLSAGMRVAVGTDSRASNPDLNLMEELRHVAQRHPNIKPETILRMGTEHGAAALGCEQSAGTLEVGKWADMAVFALPDDASGDVVELLLSEPLPCVATIIGGRVVAN